MSALNLMMCCLQQIAVLQIDLAKLFPKHTWHFPSDSYLATNAGHASAWRSLFMSLGFTDFIQAAPQTLLLSPARKADSIWAQADLGPADKNGRFTVQVCSILSHGACAAFLCVLTTAAV